MAKDRSVPAKCDGSKQCGLDYFAEAGFSLVEDFGGGDHLAAGSLQTRYKLRGPEGEAYVAIYGYDQRWMLVPTTRAFGASEVLVKNVGSIRMIRGMTLRWFVAAAKNAMAAWREHEEDAHQHEELHRAQKRAAEQAIARIIDALASSDLSPTLDSGEVRVEHGKDVASFEVCGNGRVEVVMNLSQGDAEQFAAWVANWFPAKGGRL